MKPVRNALAIAVAATLALPAWAERIPGPSTLDHRVRETRWVDGQVFRVRVALTRATTIEFGEGETILSIVAGDTESFQFEGVPGGRVMAIKPTAHGVETNVTVYTSERSYYFRLIEGESPFYVVRFNYPEKKKDINRAVARKEPSASYGVSAQTEITPISITDDGTFTYFRFAKNAPLPAIFKVSNGKERSTNSTKLENGMMRVSGTSRQWALRLGETEICVVELGNG